MVRKSNVGYPGNLIEEIFGEKFENQDEYESWESRYLQHNNVEKCLEYLYDGIGWRIADTLKLRYCKQLTYRQIGNELGVTTERARQLCVKGIIRLRRLDRKCCILLGLEQYFVLKNIDIGEYFNSTAIEYLGCSVRLYNCLKRGGMKTVEDIMNNSKKIFRIRNLGYKSAKELIIILEQRGNDVSYLKDLYKQFYKRDWIWS